MAPIVPNRAAPGATYNSVTRFFIGIFLPVFFALYLRQVSNLVKAYLAIASTIHNLAEWQYVVIARLVLKPVAYAAFYGFTSFFIHVSLPAFGTRCLR